MKNLMELKNLYELNDFDFDNVSVYFFTYDIKSRKVYVPQNTREAFDCREYYENMPQSFAEDFVAKEYWEAFYQLYDNCNNGIDNSECLFEDKSKKYCITVKLQITQRDTDGTPLLAIGVIENQMAIKSMIRNQNRYITAILANSTGYMEINLTKDRIISDIIDARTNSYGKIVNFQNNNSEERSYDEFEIWWSNNMLESDSKEFLKVSNCKYLISCFEQGKQVVDVFCRSRTDEGTVTDNKHTYYLSKDIYTGDIISMCVVYDLTKQKIKDRDLHYQNLIIQKLYDEFNAISYVDLDKDTVIDYRLDHVWEFWENPDKEKFCFSERIVHFSEYCVVPEDQKTFQEGLSLEKIRERIKKEPSYSFEYKVKVKGETYYYRTKVVADNDSKDKYRYVMISFRGIDEEKKQQHFLEETLRYAEHASRAKTSFLSNMSHDMRTPMNAIIGFTALAGAHLDDKERVKEYLEKISASSNHLLSLINDILDMSRIESGKLVLNESAENLADILHDLRSMVQSQVNAKQIDFFIDTCDVKDELIYCDKMRLKQVLLNIFGNAVKYTNPGGTVSVRIIQKENRNKDYGTYEFHIKDNGKGMSQEFLEHIFEPFEREEKKEFDSNAGTGLGLSIVKNIVDMMNGKIDVFSEKGKGSEFVVHLSFKLQDGDNEEYDFSKIQGFRALVVDDDFHTCDTVTRMLKSIGMRPDFSMYGKEAVLKAWQAYELKDEFFVYIIDWMMPDMNGLEVVRRIRKEVGDTVPIIILTAYDWDGIKDEAKQAGVTAICEKPLFMSNLKKIIANSCSEQRITEAEESIETVEAIDFKGKKVLLVEDIEINREIASEILSEAGLEVYTAENGREAVEMIEKASVGDYDIILMDIRMPEMNGYEATKIIRSMDSPYKSIPIIAMTANAFEDDRRLSFQSGMNEHISKPLNIDLLFDVLGKLL